MAAWADSAAVAELSARVGLLTDSTRSLSGRLEALIAAAPDTVRDTFWVGLVANHHQTSAITQKDMIGWGVTLFGILAAGGISVLGWIVGARIQRDSNKHRIKLEDDRRKERLIMRVRSTLEMGDDRLKSMLAFDHTQEVSVIGMKLVQQAYARYDRVSDDWPLLENPELQERMDHVLTAMNALADRTIIDEMQFRATKREVGKVTPKGIYVDPSILEEIQEFRKKLLAMVAKVRPDIVKARVMFEKALPPPTWHEADTGGDQEATPLFQSPRSDTPPA